MYEANAIGPGNIAIIKYWGARNPDINLPLNDSVSITLDENISVKTHLKFSSSFSRDRLILNDIEIQPNEIKLHMGRLLRRVREMSGLEIFAEIRSVTNFPV